MGPFKRLGIVQSMPMLSTNPRILKLAVKRAVPAKTSNAKTWLICRPTADWPVVKLSFSQRCSCNEWGLKHPGSAQTCLWNNFPQAWLPCNRWGSPSSLGVFLWCFGFVCGWVCCVLFFEDTWLFAFTYSPTCENS